MNFSIEISPVTDLDNLPGLKDVYISLFPGGDCTATADQAEKLVKKGIKLELLPSHQAVGNPKVHDQLDRFYESYRLSLSHLFQ